MWGVDLLQCNSGKGAENRLIPVLHRLNYAECEPSRLRGAPAEDAVVATSPVSTNANCDNGRRGLPRGAWYQRRNGGLADDVTGRLIAMERHDCERFI
jgi:hypothetical protein